MVSLIGHKYKDEKEYCIYPGSSSGAAQWGSCYIPEDFPPFGDPGDLFIGGLHDNYELVLSVPPQKWHGGMARMMGRFEDSGNPPMYLEPGEIFTIDDKTFFVFGGKFLDEKYKDFETPLKITGAIHKSILQKKR